MFLKARHVQFKSVFLDFQSELFRVACSLTTGQREQSPWVWGWCCPYCCNEDDDSNAHKFVADDDVDEDDGDDDTYVFGNASPTYVDPNAKQNII